MKSILLSFIFILCFVCGCSVKTPVEQNTDTQNPIVLKITDVPDEVVQVRAILSRVGYESITVYLSRTGDSASTTIQNVETGKWHLEVDALDSTSNVLYTGQTDVNVQPGLLTNVYLTLGPATGSISINVNWGPTGLKNALYLDGTTGYVEVPNSPSLSSIDTAITIEAWVKPVQQYYNTVVCKGLSDFGLEFAEGLFPGIFLTGVTAPSANYYWGRIMVPDLVADNQWNHIAMTYSNSTGVNVYFNNNLVYSASAYGLIIPGATPLRIGARVDPTYTEYFNGALGDIRIWRIVRTQNDITQNLNKELTGNEYGLVANWKFDELPNSGNIIHDSTPNHNDGQIHGSVILANPWGN